MQELFAKLVTALSAHAPDSSEVQQALQQIEARFPKEVARARALVDGFVISQGGKPQNPAPTADTSSWLSGKTLMPLLGGLGVGGGAASAFHNLSFDDIRNVPLPNVTSQWVLILIVAAVGAVVGVVHSVYRNDWSIIPPTISWNNGRLKFESLGFLRNLFFGSMISVVTTWTPMSNVATHGVVTGDTTSIEARPSLLTWGVLGSAIVAGIVGSRMSSGDVEVSTMWKALATTTEAPAEPGRGVLVENAKTPFEAVTLATGKPPPGFKPDKESSQAYAAEQELLTLIDREALKEAASKPGQPASAAVAGLTLSALEAFQPLKPGIKSLLRELEIAKVAKMSLDDFVSEMGKRGMDATQYNKLLGILHAQAIRVTELAGLLPPSWRFVS
jgi:hypothetical protein